VIRHAPILSTAATLAFSLLLTPAISFAGDVHSNCGACQGQSCRHDASDNCPKQPRVIRYNYPSGALTWEHCSQRADEKLDWNDPVAVRVCCVNPYRHTVSVKIQEQTFEELYQAPSLVSSDLLPGKASAAEKGGNNTALASAASEAKAVKGQVHFDSTTAEQAVTTACDKKDLAQKLVVFGDKADRLGSMDEFVTDQRTRVLQIEDPRELVAQSRTAAREGVKSVTAPFTDVPADVDCNLRPPQPVPFACATDRCKPEELIELRGLVATSAEDAFADLTATYNKDKAKDVALAGAATKAEGAAEAAKQVAQAAARTAAQKTARSLADAATAQANLARKTASQATTVTPDLADLYAKAQKRHDSLVSSKSQRDQQFASTMSVYANLLDADFGCVLFGPVASTGDEVDISIDTPLKDEAANFSLTPPPAATGAGTKKPVATAAAAPQVALVIPVVRRYAPSFSTGIAFSNLGDPTFSVKSGIVVRNAPDQFVPALGAMINTPIFFPSPDLTFQLSLGVALKNSNPLYVLGPSIVIGRRQRTVITAGIAGAQVTELNGLKVGDPFNGTTVPTEKTFRLGWFVGLSYNFGPTTTSSSPSSKSTTGK
jgi:hypothetical protein